MSSVRRSVVLLGLPVLLALCAAIWWLTRSVAAPAPAAPAASDRVLVHTVPVRARDMPVRVPGLGTVEAWSTVTVRTRIDGQLESVHFREGDMVREGQLLAQLDSRVQKAQLAQAEAQQARDQAQLDNARQDLRRYVELARQSAIQRQVLDTQRAQVAALQATVQADQAQVQYARVQLDYTRILAPLTGRTGTLQVDPGNVVHATDATGLVVINQMDPVAVIFTVPDTVFSQVQAAAHPGGVPAAPAASSRLPADGMTASAAGKQTADAAAPAGPGAAPSTAAVVSPLAVEVYAQGSNHLLGRGTLVLLDNQIDTASATLRLKARLDNATQSLWPGQTVDVRLILGDRPDALVVPDAAVQRGAQGLFVYAVGADDAVHAQPVSVLVSQDGLSVISQGLAAGQRVVVDGQYRLHPGARIAEAPVDDAQAAAGGDGASS